MNDPVLHLTYYQLGKTKNGGVKHSFLNRYYTGNILETNELFKKSFGIDPSSSKDIVIAVKITKEQQELNHNNYVEWCKNKGVPCL